VRRASFSYTPRKPRETVLHELVRKHLATFLEHTAATYTAPLPRYVVDAFERYLSCGDFSRGFIRCHCDGCGHDVLSLPRELSALGATRPDVLTPLGRIFAEEIARITRRVANVADSETGSLSFPQRFGGNLNLHP
jgi:hypothetical protein